MKQMSLMDQRFKTMKHEIQQIKSDKADKADLEKVKLDLKKKPDEDKIASKEELEDLKNRVASLEKGKSADMSNVQATGQSKEEEEARATEVMKEIKEREERMNNAIFFKVKESKAANADERMKDDKEIMKEIGKVCQESIKKEDIIKAIRIGKKSEQPRPLKVTFKDHDKKRRLFRNLNKLRDGPDHLKAINGTHDLTQSQRKAEKALQEEAKELEKQSGEHRYRVRGPTWARKIVKVPKGAMNQ